MQAEGGVLTSCSFVRATNSATNRKAREGVGSPDRVWPPPHPSLNQKNMTAPPTFPSAVGAGRAAWAPSLMPSGRLAQDGGGEDDAITPTQVLMRLETGAWSPPSVVPGAWVGCAVRVWSLEAEPRVPAPLSTKAPGSSALTDENADSGTSFCAEEAPCTHSTAPLNSLERGGPLPRCGN